MVYSTDESKWKAYKLIDPFAVGSFFVCNKVSKICCRPDCDARPRATLRSEIIFVDGLNEAAALGYETCSHCDLNILAIDVEMLIQCVAHVNEKIDLIPPQLDENDEEVARSIKDSITEVRNQNESLSSRRASYSHIKHLSEGSNTLSKNDNDHYKLIDLACRHLALAAAHHLFQTQSLRNNSKSPETDGSGSTKKKRRGGVLGFKELAAKSKLSAWHFHRVFKSVTGLTPKTYGDECWEYLKTLKESGKTDGFTQSLEIGYPVEPITPHDSIAVSLPLKSNKFSSVDESLDTNLSTPQITPDSYGINNDQILFKNPLTSNLDIKPLNLDLPGENVPQYSTDRAFSVPDITMRTNDFLEADQFSQDVLGLTNELPVNDKLFLDIALADIVGANNLAPSDLYDVINDISGPISTGVNSFIPPTDPFEIGLFEETQDYPNYPNGAGPDPLQQTFVLQIFDTENQIC